MWSRVVTGGAEGRGPDASALAGPPSPRGAVEPDGHLGRDDASARGPADRSAPRTEPGSTVAPRPRTAVARGG